MIHFIATFPSTQAALEAERALLGQALPVELIPVPTQIRGDCGFCLRVEAGADAPEAARRLALLGSSGTRDLWRVTLAPEPGSSRKVKHYERISPDP